jgi:hypothetical protein
VKTLHSLKHITVVLSDAQQLSIGDVEIELGPTQLLGQPVDQVEVLNVFFDKLSKDLAAPVAGLLLNVPQVHGGVGAHCKQKCIVDWSLSKIKRLGHYKNLK